MQGIYVNSRRPKSKKEVKEVIATEPHNVFLEATSIFGNEYDGCITLAPDGSYTFVGPDPHTSRKFYGTITKRNGIIKVS